jgi:MgtC family
MRSWWPGGGRAGLDGIRHAARPPARVASRRLHARGQSVADAAHSFRGQPGNDYRCHYAFTGSLVRGLTTAATLWFVTVLGLCFGEGQLALGLAVLALGVLVLGGLKRLESRWKPDRHATLSLKVDAGGPTEDELTASLQAIGYEIRPWTVTFVDQGRQRQLSAEVRWRARSQEAHSSKALAISQGCSNWEWKP